VDNFTFGIVDVKPLVGIHGTCVAVKLLPGKFSKEVTTQGLLKAYPHLAREDILAALSFSVDEILWEELKC
jgi:uncharacterized protein (DUF433 family)